MRVVHEQQPDANTSRRPAEDRRGWHWIKARDASGDLFEAGEDQLGDRALGASTVGERKHDLPTVGGERHGARTVPQDDLLEAAIGILPQGRPSRAEIPGADSARPSPAR